MNKNNLMILSGILVVALGMIGYVLFSQAKTESDQNQTRDSQSAKLEKQSNSDETDSIEKDLNNTDLDQIDKESTNIQIEINSTN